MSLKALTKNQKGFTIIEVMIVLAIAGLIILVVFLAVPALQRNSRNTQRKNDVQAVLGGLQEWINNNNGRLPNRTDNDANGQIDEALKNVTLGYYDEAKDVYWNGEIIGSGTDGDELDATTPNPTTTTPGQTPDTSDQDWLMLWSGSKCTAGVPDGTGTKNAIAISYALETGGDDDVECQES